MQVAQQPAVMPQVVMMPGAPGMYPAYQPTFQPGYPAMVQPVRFTLLCGASK